MTSCLKALLLAAVLATPMAHAASGEPDPTYGDAGLRRLSVAAPLDQLVVDAEGRASILLVDSVARLTPEGAPDATFGVAGEAPLPAGPGPSQYRFLRAAAGGKLLVAGHSLTTVCTPSCQVEHRVHRLHPDGSEDLAFGPATLTHETTFPGVRVLETYADGRFLLGTMQLLRRFLADGSPDAAFPLHVFPPVAAGIRFVAAPADGGVIVANQDSRTTATMYRLTPTGTRDMGYGDAGTVTIQVPAAGKLVLRAMQAMPDGGVAVVLHLREGDGSVEHLQVRRYRASGEPEFAFGTGGVVALPATAIPPPPIANALETASPVGIAVQADGKLLVAATDATAGFLRIAIARLLPDGAPDGTFGTGGIAYIDASAGQDQAHAVASRASGAYVLALVDAELVQLHASPQRAAVMRVQSSSASAPVLPKPLPPGGLARPYGHVLAASGGTAPYTYSLATGSLPPGITLAGDTLQGTPSSEGRYRFHVRARDALGVEGTTFLALDVHTDTSLIVDDYGAILLRAAEPAGITFWEDEVDRVRALGADPGDVLQALSAAFFGSTEFAAYRYTHEEFVARLYSAYLGRDAEAGGLAHWAARMDAGLPRGAVLNEFQFTPEFEGRLERVFGPRASRAEVRMLVDFYRGLLGRLPDSAGFGYWVGRFRAAQCGGDVNAEVEAISSLFVTLPEYDGRQTALPEGERNRGYVIDLYNAFLRRGGDLAGFSFWTQQLDSGARNREDLRRQFIASPEFQGRVQAVIAQGCMS